MNDETQVNIDSFKKVIDVLIRYVSSFDKTADGFNELDLKTCRLILRTQAQNTMSPIKGLTMTQFIDKRLSIRCESIEESLMEIYDEYVQTLKAFDS